VDSAATDEVLALTWGATELKTDFSILTVDDEFSECGSSYAFARKRDGMQIFCAIRVPSYLKVRMTSADLKKTPLNAIHRQMGARMVDYAGWEMPVQYAGPISEHLAVRLRAGIFDVSHMGELEIKGPNSQETIQRLTCNDINRLAISQCQYSALTSPEGALIDDLLIYRMDVNRFFLCVNASNQEKDFQWIQDRAFPNTEVIFRSNDYAQLAVQGPHAIDILQQLTEINLNRMKHYWFASGRFAGVDAIISRTGYTGEDGFEIYYSPAQAEKVWLHILEAGKPFGLEPAGLAARNTLRLEAGLLLYGNDMDETTSIFEAGLSWICKLHKGDFIGRDALIRQQESGVRRLLAGFEMVERGIARDRYPVELDGQRVGAVTSGIPAPFLKKSIGLAYLPINNTSIGTVCSIIIRDKAVRAQVVPIPFYRRSERN
jgi:aminomethyltransferase